MPINGEVPAPSDSQVYMPLPSANSTATVKPSVYGFGVSVLNLPNLSIPVPTYTFAFGGGSANNVIFGCGFLCGFYLLSVFHLVVLVSQMWGFLRWGFPPFNPPSSQYTQVPGGSNVLIGMFL